MKIRFGKDVKTL